MIFGWFDTAEEREFARAIAEQYERLRKSTAMRMDDAGKRSGKFAKLAAKVAEYRRTKKPNFYKQARMIDAIRDDLRKRKIPEDEIAAFVSTLLTAPIA